MLCKCIENVVLATIKYRPICRREKTNNAAKTAIVMILINRDRLLLKHVSRKRKCEG